MRLADVLDTCSVKAVTIGPEAGLIETVQAMDRAGAVVVFVARKDTIQGFLTARDIVRAVAGSPALSWYEAVSEMLAASPKPVLDTEPVGRIIAKMASAGIDYLPVTNGKTTVVIALGRLLLMENASLHGEVQHLQTYIDALHDAPND